MKNFIALVLTLLTIFVKGQTVTYQSDISNFSNPERGQYHYTSTGSSGYTLLKSSTLLGYKTNESITLIWRNFYLNAFKKIPISSAYLANMQTDFNAIRASGTKAIVRFSYTKSSGTDATKAIILSHIEQLKPILKANEDVISSIEAGFIGDYGEWYNSVNFGTDNLTSTQLANRKEVGLAIMNMLPSRMVAFRTPTIQRLIAGSTAITSSTAYNGSVNSRTASHNDCFLSSSSDYGTYINTTTDYTYLENQSKYTFDGGETCSLTVYSECSNAIATMNRFHFNYLNIDYNSTVLSYWKTNGCYDEIVRRLGYRFELASSSITNKILTINLKNVGFSNIFNSRPVFLVLKNKATGVEYSKQLATDIKLWQTGITTIISEPLNYTFPNGDYDSFLWIPDNVNRTSQYAIRLANVGVWDFTKGYNNLLQTITINNQSVKISLNNRVVNVSGVSNYTVKIYDMQGLLVSKETDTSNLRSGIYIVKVNVDGVVYSKKISF